MASSSQSERKGLKEDQETESSISKTIQRVGGGGAVEVELGLDGGPRGEGLADERSFRRTSRDEAGMSYGWVEENRRQDGVQGVSRKVLSWTAYCCSKLDSIWTGRACNGPQEDCNEVIEIRLLCRFISCPGATTDCYLTAWAGAVCNLLLYMIASHVELHGICFHVTKEACQEVFLLSLVGIAKAKRLLSSFPPEFYDGECWEEVFLTSTSSRCGCVTGCCCFCERRDGDLMDAAAGNTLIRSVRLRRTSSMAAVGSKRASGSATGSPRQHTSRGITCIAEHFVEHRQGKRQESDDLTKLPPFSRISQRHGESGRGGFNFQPPPVNTVNDGSVTSTIHSVTLAFLCD
ncbi:hypothetical protein OPV22_023619 [Ensete ventricosum]|uniref:Uncharacterized protein n=1 Tax=Ensete ventricosum TaxID=4639 RepID=A0AAV8QM92_ENSVE|nr:hypothetical protein OPV22_023619 [Ensete ventricosum]